MNQRMEVFSLYYFILSIKPLFMQSEGVFDFLEQSRLLLKRNLEHQINKSILMLIWC